MTVRMNKGNHEYTGVVSDVKPIWRDHNSTAGGYLPQGAIFEELDSRRKYIFDGNGTWYETYPASQYYLDTRTSIAITTTSSHLYSGGSITKYGDLLRQYTIELSDSTGDPTRTVSLTDSNSVIVWSSTAITDNTNTTRLLPTSEQVILEGTYSIVWTLSTNSPTTGITDYMTFGFQRT